MSYHVITIANASACSSDGGRTYSQSFVTSLHLYIDRNQEAGTGGLTGYKQGEPKYLPIWNVCSSVSSIMAPPEDFPMSSIFNIN